MGIAVLGPLTVDGDAAVLGPRDRVVLAALAVRPGAVLSAERLADALWGEQPPASWSKVVQGCVVRLRKALGSQAVETLPQGYRLVVAADEVDAQRFGRLVERGRELLTLGEPERALYVTGEALALWRGRALADLDGWDEGEVESRRLEELRLDAQELRLDAALRAGHHREVLAEAQARVAEAPIRERRWALLALAQYQAGRQGEALQTLHRVRTMLANELGLDPGPDLIALEQAILRQDPSLVAEAALPKPSATCPYLGLVPYDIGDTDAFFGRDADVTACLRRLATVGVLAVVGPSGSGKSSLVRAGVAAALQRDGRRVAVITPGARPLDALTVLPASGPIPVLVVDQCEEVFSLCDDATEQARFFAALTEHAERGQLVVALRADRLGDLSAHARFARLVERGLYLLSAMGEADLRAAIEGPALQAGLPLEPGLVDLLVREVEGEPGALPLLSHALHETWQRREGRTLTVTGYRETGGIRGAVAQSAEDVYARVEPEQRPLLRDLLLRLVTPDGEGEPVRSRMPRRLLIADREHERLMELLIGARLVTSDDGVVELAHEALARAWPRLRAWLDEDSEGQRILRHLTVAADNWEALDRPDSELYRGARLARALDWRGGADAGLTPSELAFLDAGRKLAETERQTAEDRARYQARVNRRLRALLTGVAVLLAAAIVAGLVAVREADRADTAAIAADARRVGAQALVTENIDQSLLLAVEGVRLDDSPDTRANLLAALARNPRLIGSTRGAGGFFYNLNVSPDGTIVAVYDDANRVWFYDTATGESVGTFDAFEGSETRALIPTSPLSFRPDGEQLAVGLNTLDPVPVRLLDVATLEQAPAQLGGLPATPSLPWDLAYSADGRYLAVAFRHYQRESSLGSPGALPDSSSVMVWAVAAPEQPVARVDVAGFSHALALSPDGRLLYTGTSESASFVDDEQSLTIYDVATGEPMRSLRVPSFALELSPDGTLLATATGTDVVLLDAATGAELTRLQGHTEPVNSVRFSHGGDLLASSADRTAIVWDVATREPLAQLRGHSSMLWALGLSPDGATLYTAAEQMLLTWDLRGDRRFIPGRAIAEPAVADGGWIALAPSGDALAYWWNGEGEAGVLTAWLQVLDLDAGRAGEVIDTGHMDYGGLSWHPGSRRLATTGRDGIVREWDPGSGELRAERRVAGGHIAALDYTDDGERLLVGERAGALYLVDAETLEPVGEPVQLDQRIRDAFAGPDNRIAFAFTSDTAVSLTANTVVPTSGFTLVDLVSGRVLHAGELSFSAESADFSPDGRRVAVGGRDGEVVVLDVATREPVRPPVTGHDGIVIKVAYAPDGATLVSGGDDGLVGLWDGHTGALLGTVLPAGPNTVTIPDFLPDGYTVLIPSWDNTVSTWDTNPEHWVEFACTVARRNLTADEWRNAFGDRPYRETCPT